MEVFNETINRELLNGCRACGGSDNYMNLFYNINKELLRSLISLTQSEIKEGDGLSKWLCRQCAETVEMFIRFQNTYNETSRKFQEAITKVECSAVEYEVETLHESDIGNNASPDEEEQTTESKSVPKLEGKRGFHCDFCPKVYRFLNSLTRHVKTAHERFRHQCSLCSQEFTQKTSLVEHMRNIHKDSADDSVTHAVRNSDSAHVCNSCDRSFNTAKMLQQHKKLHSVEKKEVTKKSPEKQKYRKQCTICGHFFKHIEEHKLSHQSENTFRCQYAHCQKTFKFKTSLDVHVRIHSNERRFECHVCNKKFRVSHHLKEHLSTHSTVKNFICDVKACGKKFSSKLNLYKHSKLHLRKSSLIENKIG